MDKALTKFIAPIEVFECKDLKEYHKFKTMQRSKVARLRYVAQVEREIQDIVEKKMKEELARGETPSRKTRKPKSPEPVPLEESLKYDGMIEEPTIDIRKTVKMDQQQKLLPKAMKQLAVKLNKFDRELSELPEDMKKQLAAAHHQQQQQQGENGEQRSEGSSTSDIPDIMTRSIDYEELFLNSNLADQE